MGTGNVAAWIEILQTLAAEEIARILDKSPTLEAALDEAAANARKAKEEAEALRNEGHE